VSYLELQNTEYFCRKVIRSYCLLYMHLNTPEHLIAFYTRTQHASTSYCLLHTHPTRQHILLPPTHAPNTPAHLIASYTRTQHVSTSYCLLNTHLNTPEHLIAFYTSTQHASTSYCLLHTHPTRQHISQTAPSTAMQVHTVGCQPA